MEISAQVRNNADSNVALVATSGVKQSLPVTAKASGRGSSVNGGEFLMLALATCYCNDLYREAERLGVFVNGCEVCVSGQFNGVGLAAESITYSAKVDSPASPEAVELLLAETDRLAEVHNTLRAGCSVQRLPWREPAA